MSYEKDRIRNKVLALYRQLSNTAEIAKQRELVKDICDVLETIPVNTIEEEGERDSVIRYFRNATLDNISEIEKGYETEAGKRERSRAIAYLLTYLGTSGS